MSDDCSGLAYNNLPIERHSLLGPPVGCLMEEDQVTEHSVVESPAAQFFIDALEPPEKEHVKRLVDTVQGFSELSSNLDISPWSHIFGIEPQERVVHAKISDEERLLRLKNIRTNIQKKDWEASRLWFICLAHEVKYISKGAYSDAWTKRGMSRLDVATDFVKEHLSLSGECLKKSKKILRILIKGGPAALLVENGGKPSSFWERKLTISDIDLVYAYKKERLPDLDKQTRLYDAKASQAIKDCFLAYGWSSQELLSSDTDVMAILKPYIPKSAGNEAQDSGSTYNIYSPKEPTPELEPNQTSYVSQTSNVHLSTTQNRFTPFSHRNLTDTATMSELDNVVRSSEELTNSTTILLDYESYIKQPSFLVNIE